MPKEITAVKPHKEADIEKPTRDVAIRYQIHLTFIVNSYVVMVTLAVAEDELLEDRITLFKNEIANSIRIYGRPININALSYQIEKKLKGESYIVSDTISGIKIKIPFWLNVQESDYEIFATFPDINNISNALLLTLFNKSRFNSIEELQNKFLKGKDVIKHEKIEYKNQKLDCFKVLIKTSYGKFDCQFVFFQTKNTFGFLNFTATESTYDKNLSKFNEFLAGIEIE